jgi:hypothetical protein
MFGFDMPSALLCPARFCTPDVVGGVVILPSMTYLGNHHHLTRLMAWLSCLPRRIWRKVIITTGITQ